MLSQAAKYSYLNAKVRGLRSRKLTKEDFHFLQTVKDLTVFLSYLSTTSYAPYLPEHPTALSELASLERKLSKPLMEDYGKVSRCLHGHRERKIIYALFRRFEEENLKLLLRALFAHQSRVDVAHLLYPLSRVSDVDWNTLWGVESIPELIERVPYKEFRQSLKHAYPQFEAQGRLFPLEMALDQSCFALLLKAVQELGSHDRKSAHNILGPYIDTLNISWVIRLKTMYGFSPEEIINYTLPQGGQITLSCMSCMARAENIGDFIACLPVALQREILPADSYTAIANYLGTYLVRILARVFIAAPFHLGTAIAYLLEKEIELTTIISLLQGKAMHLEGDAIHTVLEEQQSGEAWETHV